MALTVRKVVEEKLYRFLKSEQASIPYSGSNRDPLPEALEAINGTLQTLAVFSPLFASKQTKSLLFRAAESVVVTGGTQYASTITKATSWEDRMLGCKILLAGETQPNRIVSISTTTATLQNPILASSAIGGATVYYDAAELPSDVISVNEPVRFVGGYPLRPANGRFNLDQPLYTTRDDYGRLSMSSVQGSPNAYFIESFMQSGASRPKLRMMLRDAPSIDSIVEYQARVTLGHFTTADVYGAGPGYADPQTPVPVPSDFVESIFLPLATVRFYGSSLLQNVDLPAAIAKQAQEANELLETMRPQARRTPSLYPAFR